VGIVAKLTGYDNHPRFRVEKFPVAAFPWDELKARFLKVFDQLPNLARH